MLFSLVVATGAQVSKLQTQTPAWNDTITIIYNIGDTAAVLTAGEKVYARITCFMQDGSFNKQHVALQGHDNLLQQLFVVPVHAASLRVEFYTLNKDDASATINIPVYTPAHTIPVEGAYMDQFFTDTPERPFTYEMRNYPGNYFAYAKYFNVISMLQPDAAKTIIQPLLHTADSVYKKGKASAGVLTALCIGYAKTGQLSEAKKYMCRLLNLFPAAGETAFAFSIYNYEYYKASNRDIEDDIRDSVKQIFMQYPQSELAGDANLFYYLSKDASIPISSFENVFLPRYYRGDIEYYALGELAGLYIERNIKVDTAKAMLLHGIQLFNTAEITHQYRLSPSRYKTYVAELLLALAKADLVLQDYNDAVTHTSAAMAIVSGANIEGNFTNDILRLRATAYKRMGNFNLALEDYKALYKNGDMAVADSISAVFNATQHTQNNITAFLAALKGSGNTKTANALPPAPAFTGVDMNGDTVKLSNLKGKTVVLNYWGTGCGPCIAEMPTLNKLVEQNKNKANVVFIAATLDEKERLQNFFKLKKFDYRVFMVEASFTKEYNIDALPVHIVIGKNGEIISRSVGSRPDIKEYLQGFIDRDL